MNLSHRWARDVIRDDVSGRELNCARQVYSLRNVWKKMSLGTTTGDMAATIAPHDILALRLVK